MFFFLQENSENHIAGQTTTATATNFPYHLYNNTHNNNYLPSTTQPISIPTPTFSALISPAAYAVHKRRPSEEWGDSIYTTYNDYYSQTDHSEVFFNNSLFGNNNNSNNYNNNNYDNIPQLAELSINSPILSSSPTTAPFQPAPSGGSGSAPLTATAGLRTSGGLKKRKSLDLGGPLVITHPPPTTTTTHSTRKTCDLCTSTRTHDKFIPCCVCSERWCHSRCMMKTSASVNGKWTCNFCLNGVPTIAIATPPPAVTVTVQPLVGIKEESMSQLLRALTRHS